MEKTSLEAKLAAAEKAVEDLKKAQDPVSNDGCPLAG
jgi:hypothetical protein